MPRCWRSTSISAGCSSASGAGADTQLTLIGTFADQEDVVLPYSYVNARVGDTSVVRLTEGGTLLSLTEGATFLQVTRGNISAATTLTVGSPQQPTS